MRSFRFYKEDNRWYVDIESPFEKEELEMVSGADSLLDIISQGEDEVFTTIDTHLLNYSYNDFKTTLTKTSEDEFGAWYRLDRIHGIDYTFPVWLCPVTKYLFGEYPEIIRIDY